MTDIDDVEALIAEARPPERVAWVCLRGDLIAEHERATAELSAARAAQRDDTDMASAGAVRALAEHVQQVEAQVEAARVPFTFRALPPAEWMAMTRRHQNGDDLEVDGFFAELVPACCVSPAMTGEQWQRLSGRLSHAQADEVQQAAWLVNRGAVDVGKSLTASAVLASQPSAGS